MKSASALIVGGGVIGASVAWHLARLGWRDVVIADRARGPGAGSSAQTAGVFHTSFGAPLLVRLSLLSREKLSQFREDTGGDPGYAARGHLLVAKGAEEMEKIRNLLRTQRSEGVIDVRELGADEVVRLNPALAPQGITGGAFSPSDGVFRPMQLLEGYLTAAERQGVRILWGTEVQAFKRSSVRRITGAITSLGTMRVGAVVNATGAWAAPLADRAGVALPVLPLRRQVLSATAGRALPPNLPPTRFASDGLFVRRDEDRLLVMRPSPGIRGRPWDTTVEPTWIEETTALVRERFPALAGAPLDTAGSWGGLYEISPDHHPVLGASAECENFYMVNGCSGHGAMHAPALGQLLAEVMTDGQAPAMDVVPLRLARFSEGRANPGPVLP
ncbi:MAG TPA: FAD-dependent oxidoreductase [Gemmatimonadales bacterium]|nr:FAD-dependent oxidoreductase [Gemmatimonadales bacterium]